MLLTMLLIGAIPPADPSPPAPCPLIYPVAPDQPAARRIAEAVIAARPHPLRQRFVLLVMPDRDDLAQWVAVQMLPHPMRDLPPGRFYVQAGGGGVGMRIDRCTGAVSQLYYQR